MKQFLKYLVLGVCMTAPITVYAGANGTLSTAPDCCITCDNANRLQICYVSCTSCDSVDHGAGTTANALCRHWCSVQDYPTAD